MSFDRKLAIVLTIAVSSSSAFGVDLFTGTGNGIGSVYRGDALYGGFQSFGAGGAAVQSMLRIGDEILLGTPTGYVVRIDRATGQVTGGFAVANDARAMARYNDSVFVGGTDGTVYRIDPQTGHVLHGPIQAATDVRAMAIHDGTLFVGGSAGMVYRVSVYGTSFQAAYAVSAGINSLAVRPQQLAVGDENGDISVFSLINDAVLYGYDVPTDATAIVPHGSEFLISGSNGTIVRVVPETSTITTILTAPTNIRAMVLDEDFPSAWLGADDPRLSVSRGETAHFDLAVTQHYFGSGYFLLGSFHGDAPGLWLPGFVLPLNPDVYFFVTRTQPDLTLTGSIGTFPLVGPSAGVATASFSVPAVLAPYVAGRTVHHAYVVLDPGTGEPVIASNAVAITIDP